MTKENTYKTKNPITLVEKLMSTEEVKELVTYLLMESGFETYELTGLMFMFQTFSELANQDQVELQDMCDQLKGWLFTESAYCTEAEKRLSEGISNRYRNTNWKKDEVEVYNDIETEFSHIGKAFADPVEESVLDLSAHPENLNINPDKEFAELLSKVLNHPSLTTDISLALGNAISESGDSQLLVDFQDSPAVIYEYLFGSED